MCRYGHSVYRSSMSIKGEQQACLTALHLPPEQHVRITIGRRRYNLAPLLIVGVAVFILMRLGH